MDFSHIDMNTLITIAAFLFTLVTQLIMWAYSTGKASQMIEILRRDIDEHKKQNDGENSLIRAEISTIKEKKNEEHAEFKTKIATHDQMFTNLVQNMVELKETNREVLSLIRELSKKN